MPNFARLAELEKDRETSLGRLTSDKDASLSVHGSKKDALHLNIEAAKQHIADIDGIVEAVKAGLIS
jgi:hypothetical protein